MAGRIFKHAVVVTIGHTNMQKTAYWVRYADWFGEVRELFMLELMKMSGFSAPEGLRLDEVFEQAQIALETADFHINYFRPLFFGDEVVICVSVKCFTEDSVVLIGEFRKGEEKVACCKQRIVFFNPVANQRVPIPEFLLSPAREFEVVAACH